MKKYEKHKNKCSRLYKKERKRHFDTLGVNKITHKKKEFLKNIQTLSSDKRKLANKITLEDSEENILSDDTLVLVELNNFLENGSKNFCIVDSRSSITDPVSKGNDTYRNYPSI